MIGQESLSPINITIEEYLASLPPEGIPDIVLTGFYDLDRLIDGLFIGSLNVLGGVTGVGKTAVTLGIARNAAVRFNQGVAFFSLQQPASQISERLLATESGIPISYLRNPDLSGHKRYDETRLGSAQQTLSISPLYISDTPIADIDQIAKIVQNLPTTKLVIIDSLDDIQKKVRPVDLKKLAQEINVALLITSPLNKSVYRRAGKIPSIEDLPRGREMLNVADFIMLMSKDDWEYRRGIMDFSIVKNRSGLTGTFSLGFDERTMQFVDLQMLWNNQGDRDPELVDNLNVFGES